MSWKNAGWYYDPSDESITGDELFDNIFKTSPMVQLIIKYPENLNYGNSYQDVVLPYTSRDNYSCYTEQVGSRVEMLSGRTVWEARGTITKIHYAYDAMPMKLWKQLSFILRSSMSFPVYYLRDDDDVNLYEGEFICESLTPPKLAYAEPDYFIAEDDNTLALPRWHGVDFTLREVNPGGSSRATVGK